MVRIASLTLVVGAVLLMTWVLAPAATPPQRAGARNPAAGDPAQAAAPTPAEIQTDIDRLRTRLANPPDYPLPVRDPFRFGRRPDAPHREAPAAVVVTPPSALPRLVAILSDTVDGELVRRAALAIDGAVRIVGVGEMVGTLRIRAVTADAVELTDPATSATFRLSLR
jgi:hypothetical protein